ncbi:MAG TPA: DUF3667 domain-containing protein [Rubricoccaceae bacterium]|jgi:hypothetical protein|nr:DUF3667 domain-containing protein [Rubricoccaceae bacterium]
MPEVSIAPPVEGAPALRPTPAVPSAEPEADRCLECEAVLTGRYCSECGQKALDERALWARNVFQDVFNKFLRVDGRFFRAVYLLLLQPGLLTADFVAGRRQRHLAPTKLYFLINFFFFLLVQQYDPITAEIAAEIMGPGTWAAAQAQAGMSADLFGATVEDRIAGLFPTWLFVLVVVNGLVLGLLYRRHRLPLGAHAVFAFHFLAFALIAFTPGTVLGGSAGETVNNVAILLALPVWLAFALRRVYGQGWGATLLKTLALWTCFILSIYFYFLAITAWAMTRV